MQNRIKAYNDLTIFSGKGLNTRPHAHHALGIRFHRVFVTRFGLNSSQLLQ